MDNQSRQDMSRRDFVTSGLAVSGLALLYSGEVNAAAPKRKRPGWFPEGVYPSYQDEKTGVEVFTLTPGGQASSTVYQTHPMWTPEMQYFLFTSDRDGTGARLHLLELKSGTIRPVMDRPCGGNTMTWKNSDLYYIRDREVYVLDVIKAFHGGAEPRRIGRLPESCKSVDGTITVDAALRDLYFGGVTQEGKAWAIYAMDTTSGQVRTLAETDFRVGHFQANRTLPGSIMFCQESGGDTAQRIWHINGDGSDMKPLYKEHFGEWVTHEVWWDEKRFLFTLWPYDEEHKRQPHGIAVSDVLAGPEGGMELLAQYPAWHTHGSPDGQWVMGDDFDRSIWLIDVPRKERKLLTCGHASGKYNTHPHGSFTPDSSGIVFSSSKNGVEEVMFVPLPDWECLA